ncbi:hypothetical protein HMI56_001126, partial [Coelomomyces lativittatus]
MAFINFTRINNTNKHRLHKFHFSYGRFKTLKTWEDLYSLKNLNLKVHCQFFDPLNEFEVIIPFKFQKTSLLKNGAEKKSLSTKENLIKKIEKELESY